MSLSFGKLMKEAKKNSEDVNGKLKTANDSGKKLNSNSGPSYDAVKAFLEKKKAAEKMELNKKLETKKKLEEQRSKDLKKHKKQSDSNQETSKNPPKSAENSHKSVNPPVDRKALEQKKLEFALKKAKEKFKNQQLENHKNEKHEKKIAASNLEKSKTDKTNVDKNKSLANFKIPTVKIPKNQPVDFVKLMQVAVKNRESGAHFDDFNEKKSSNVDKNNNIGKRKLSNSSEEMSSKKPKIVPLGPKNKIDSAHAGNKKPDVKNKGQFLKKNDSKVPKSTPQPSKSQEKSSKIVAKPKIEQKQLVQNGKIVEKFKDGKILNGKIGLKSIDKTPANKLNLKISAGKPISINIKPVDKSKTAVSLSNSKQIVQKPGNANQKLVNGSQKPVNGLQKPVNGLQKPVNGLQKPVNSLQKPVNGLQKPVNSLQKPVISNQKPVFSNQKSSLNSQKSLHPPIKRPGTPPSSGSKIACRRPGTPPSGGNSIKTPYYRPTNVNLPSTSNQMYAKKSDQQRALMLRREMMFKNPERYAPSGESGDYSDYEDEEDDDDSMDSFIDDTDFGDEDKFESYTKEIRKMFKYNPEKYKFMDDRDDPRMETNYKEIEKEEARSARLGLLEDLEDIQREQAELKRRQTKKK